MKFTQWLLLQMILLRLAMMSAPPAPPVALGKLSKRRISHTVVDSGQVSAAVSFASSAKDVAEPQLPESTWRCMICSDLCAVCVPAARIGSIHFTAAVTARRRPTSSIGALGMTSFVSIILPSAYEHRFF